LWFFVGERILFVAWTWLDQAQFGTNSFAGLDLGWVWAKPFFPMFLLGWTWARFELSHFFQSFSWTRLGLAVLLSCA